MRTTTLALALLTWWASTAQTAQTSGRPNVLVILADDQGYADLGVQGCKDIPTPNIDSLAQHGIRCTSGYVSGPYCSPTRAGLMTGRYQQRYGHEFNPGPAATAASDFGLPLGETTLADRLQAAGYSTALVGKWHLGYAARFHPEKRGFQQYFGFLGGAHSYLDWKADANNPILRGTAPVIEPTYLTDAFKREAVAYLQRQKQERKPFFLYLAFNAVHTPLQATQQYLDRFGSIADRRRRTYAAMTAAMDDAVGDVLKALRKAGQEENTLIFYLSDNGGPPANASNNFPLRGHKAQTLEGGIRVPWIVQWKGHLPAGKTYDQPVIQLDICATALAAAGVRITPEMKLDGVNLLPYLNGKNRQPPHQALFWRFGRQMAIRMGDWKLVRHNLSEELELYNLKDDIGERKDLAKDKPDKLKELKAAWDQWDSTLVAPRWGGPGKAKQAKAKDAKQEKQGKQGKKRAKPKT
jgi:arylsulfatase A-like enzyme